MPLVTVTGKALDASGVPIPAAQQPRLFVRPTESTVWGETAYTGDEVECEYVPSTGGFRVQLDNRPGIRYTLWMDRLRPGQESEPPERRARSWEQWSRPFHPGEGGPIGDITPEPVGPLWYGPTPPPGGPNYPVGTRWLVTDENSADYGWIVKWS